MTHKKKYDYLNNYVFYDFRCARYFSYHITVILFIFIHTSYMIKTVLAFSSLNIFIIMLCFHCVV